MRKLEDSGIEWIGEIPADWTLQRGKTIFAQRLTKGNQSEILLAATQKYGMLPQSEVEGVVQVKEDADLQQFRTVHKKDFVISLRSFQGGFEYSQYEGVCSPAYQVFYNTTPICHDYYRLLFKSDGFIQKMNSMTVGIREGKNIQYSDFANSLIPVPPINQQHRIADYLDRKCSQIDAIIARQQEVIEKLKVYKLSIITEAVTKGLNPDVPMKNSGVEWIGEIPQFTTVTCARHLYEIILGKMLSPVPKNEEDTLESYFCAANIHFSDIDYDNLKTMWFSKEERRNYLVSLGDLLIVEGGAGAGGAHIVEKSVENCYIQNSIMIARSKSSVSNKWLYYTLYSLVNREYIDFVCNKATIPHFTKDKLGNTPVVFFPREIEKSIIVFLDKKCSNIDKLIFQKKRVIEQLTAYKKSLIYEVVTGKKEV